LVHPHGRRLLQEIAAIAAIQLIMSFSGDDQAIGVEVVISIGIARTRELGD
jgi:hypothetical protein